MRTDASSPSAGTRVATGTYTGDGLALQAVVGVGFQPRFLTIYRQDELVNRTPGWKTDQDGVNCYLFDGTANVYAAQPHIVSLDADGFTVGDGAPVANLFNVAGIIYTYIAFG